MCLNTLVAKAEIVKRSPISPRKKAALGKLEIAWQNDDIEPLAYQKALRQIILGTNVRYWNIRLEVTHL